MAVLFSKLQIHFEFLFILLFVYTFMHNEEILVNNALDSVRRVRRREGSEHKMTNHIDAKSVAACLSQIIHLNFSDKGGKWKCQCNPMQSFLLPERASSNMTRRQVRILTWETRSDSSRGFVS